METIMSELDEIKNKFAEQLEKNKQAHAGQLESDLQALRANLPREFRASLPPDLGRQAEAVAAKFTSRAAPSPARALVDMAKNSNFQEYDETFIEIFHLDAYYPAFRLRYPTKYCETLGEFSIPQLSQEELSPEEHQKKIKAMVAELEEQARKGKLFKGYYISGLGAFINGWLFDQLYKCSEGEAYKRADAWPHILETAIHEKLGHGFLSEYSALGQVENQLGLTQLASRTVRPAS
jgi:hypothetical protein